MAEKACLSGEPAACFELGLNSIIADDFQHTVVPISDGPAATLLARKYDDIGAELILCAEKNNNRCAPSGEMMAAINVARRAVAEELAQKSVELVERCNHKDSVACADLSRDETNPKRAAAFAQRACELGSIAGCLRIAELRALGSGVPKDEEWALAENDRAGQLLTASACGDAGSIEACLAATELMRRNTALNSVLVAPDKASTACDLGSATTCMQLATAFFIGGPATPKDSDKGRALATRAISIWKASCENGDGPSCRRIAEELRSPDPFSSGSSPQYERSALYATKGCRDAHDLGCCYILAGFYERGDGVTKDPIRATRCREVAEGRRETGCP